MATKYWKGTALAVAQVSTVTVGTHDATTLYEIRVNGLTIARSVGAASNTATATALAAAWNASTHPYRQGITATSAAAVVTLTGVAGMPFTVTVAVTTGTGTISTATPTAATGPHHWDNAANWSDGALPASTDTVIFRDNAVNVCWGLNQAAVALAELQIWQSYTGRIGLPLATVAASANGETANAGADEYRDRYLRIAWTAARIGEHAGPGTPSGSPRLKLDNAAAGASTTLIANTAAAGIDPGLPAVRLKANNASARVNVRLAPGGLGLAADEPTETSTFGAVVIADTSELSRVYSGPGATLASWQQSGGNNQLRAAATLASCTVLGGQLAIDGAFAITALTVEGGICYPNNVPASGAAVVTATLNGGLLDFTQSPAARTVTTLNPNRGELRADKNVLTVTTFAQPANLYRAAIR
jgi:hypothetical protein